MTSMLIRDLSVYDTSPINYGAYDGFIPRCYSGRSKDTLFETHKAGARQAGKPWWPYAFYNFNYPAAPQVYDVNAILQPDPGALPVFWDVEEWGSYRYPARAVLIANLKVLHDGTLSGCGKKPGYYMNPATIHYLKPIPQWLIECPLWIANWGVSRPDFEPWQNYQFWQYHGEPDLNCYSGTEAEYWAFFGGQPPVPPPLPSKVVTTTGALNIRSTPLGGIIGQAPLGTVFGVTGCANDNLGRKWWRCGSGYIASWFTVEYDG